MSWMVNTASATMDTPMSFAAMDQTDTSISG